jgi:hypothetical protein
VGVRVGVGEGLNEGEVVGVGVRDEGAGVTLTIKNFLRDFIISCNTTGSLDCISCIIC